MTKVQKLHQLISVFISVFFCVFVCGGGWFCVFWIFLGLFFVDFFLGWGGSEEEFRVLGSWCIPFGLNPFCLPGLAVPKSSIIFEQIKTKESTLS